MFLTPANEKIKFLVIGGLNTFFSCIINLTLFKLFNDQFDYKLIVFVSTIFSLIFNFFSYNLFLYKKYDNLKLRITKFFISGFFLIIISMLVFIFFYGYLNILYEITILISVLISMIFTYSSNKFFVFNISANTK